jgi:hypothetical protein
MTESINETPPAEKVYYYYPGYDKKHHRRVIAGLESEGRILVAEAITFSGRKKDTMLKEFYPVWEIKPDIFNKAKGRMIALNRARMGKTFLELPIPAGCTSPSKFFKETLDSYYAARKFPTRVAKKAEAKPVNPEPGPVNP